MKALVKERGIKKNKRRYRIWDFKLCGISSVYADLLLPFLLFNH